NDCVTSSSHSRTFGGAVSRGRTTRPDATPVGRCKGRARPTHCAADSWLLHWATYLRFSRRARRIHVSRRPDLMPSHARLRMIGDVFQTPVAEKIPPVIKVGETDDERKLAAEIGSYVVTPLIEKHLDTFLDHYTDTILKDTDEIGVWISG